MTDVIYPIMAVVYITSERWNNIAVVAAETEKEAHAILEDCVRNAVRARGNLHEVYSKEMQFLVAKTENTGYSTTKKGVILLEDELLKGMD